VLCGPFFLLSLPPQREVRPHGARRQQKEDPMSINGTVKFFNSDKGYGFIAPDNGGADAFVHISAVERAGMATLNQDQRVSYELEQDKRGKMAAVNLQPVD
jgi:CspA family cold shock protein